jgi:hypothetical protein
MVKRIVLSAALVLAACSPDLVDDTSIVSAPRLIAVRAEPAEAAPGAQVSFHALYADPTGGVAAAPLDWAFCTARRPVSESGPVDPACLVAASDDLVPIGAGNDATGALPAAGCRLFGPDRPDPVPGEPAGRPADADSTGGYYQPVRVLTPDGQASLVQSRLRCGLPGATAEQAADFRQRSHPNANPTVAVSLAGTPLVALEDDATAVATVAPGATITLQAAWPACPATEPTEEPAPCAGSEAYLFFDPVSRSLVVRRESLRVSWLATAGAFASGHTGRSEAEATAAPTTENTWTAPASGTVTLWVVLRDDRGGTDWRTYRVAIAP